MYWKCSKYGGGGVGVVVVVGVGGGSGGDGGVDGHGCIMRYIYFYATAFLPL